MQANDNIRHTPRLFVESDLTANSITSIEGDQAHYLRNVMRMKAGDTLRLFNGRDGEFLASFAAASKSSVEVSLGKQLRKQQSGADLWLCAAPIKKAHFDYMIEKATELGVAVIQPILTARTQIREVNIERCRAIAVESAEQSERLDIPEIRAPMTLKELKAKWPKDRVPVVCAELGDAAAAHDALHGLSNPKAAILTGPEGGFAADELEGLQKMPNALFIRLGPRILRADTAAIAALTLWQAMCGDWEIGTSS